MPNPVNRVSVRLISAEQNHLLQRESQRLVAWEDWVVDLNRDGCGRHEVYCKR